MKPKTQGPNPKATIQKAKILSNTRIKNNYFKAILFAPKIALVARPGQFINAKITESTNPLLRRPFSIHRVSAGNIEILYEVLGGATALLSKKKQGAYLDIIGPLGNGFDIRTAYSVQRTAILVAGGMGVAPLVLLAAKLREIRTKDFKPKLVVLIGAKTKEDILCEKEFKSLGCSVKIATDDGSIGSKSYVSELLKKELSIHSYQLSVIYACGPHPMLKEVSLVAKKHNIPSQISLEEHMACGIGACLGCVVKCKTSALKRKDSFEYKRVCKEGPVFEAGEIIWE